MTHAYDPKFGLSVSYVPHAVPEEVVGRLERFGFTAAELSIPYIEAHREGILLLRDRLACLTCHLPFDDAHRVLARDAEEDARVLERQKRNIELAASVGCRTFVLHLGNIVGQRLEDTWDRSVSFARRLGDFARGFDAAVGVENCLPVVGRAEIARRFIDAVGADNVGLTLDTGHFWSILEEDEFGRYRANPLKGTEAGGRLLNEMCLDMARAAGDRLLNIHIHNLRPGDWKDHQPLDEHGVMDIGPLFDALRRNRYDRAVMIELRPDGGWQGFESSAAYLQRFR